MIKFVIAGLLLRGSAGGQGANPLTTSVRASRPAPGPRLFSYMADKNQTMLTNVKDSDKSQKKLTKVKRRWQTSKEADRSQKCRSEMTLSGYAASTILRDGGQKSKTADKRKRCKRNTSFMLRNTRDSFEVHKISSKNNGLLRTNRRLLWETQDFSENTRLFQTYTRLSPK